MKAEGEGLRHVEARAMHGARFRYFDFVMVAFVVVLLLSNVIGAEKRSFVTLPAIGPWPFGAGILFFPISYVIDDVLTEVYGYARARRAIWAGFAALAFMAVMELTVVHLPVAPGWTGQAAYERVFGSGWRIIVASMTAFFVGEFLNSVVMAKMKIWSRGRRLWMRFWGSTIVGEGADSLIFYPLAFYGMADWPVATLGDAQPVCPEGELGGAPDAGDLRRRRLAQTQGRCRRLRCRHGLHPIRNGHIR
jgi:queuosine precursor transporter